MQYKKINVRYDHWSMSRVCWYIGVPKEHPMFWKNYIHKIKSPSTKELKQSDYGKNFPVIPLFCMEEDDLDNDTFRLDVACPCHWWLTFAGHRVDWTTYEERFFGFDTNHAGDNESDRTDEYINEQLDKMEKFFTSLENYKWN